MPSFLLLSFGFSFSLPSSHLVIQLCSYPVYYPTPGESLEASSQTTTSEKSVYSAVFTRGGMKKIAQHLSQNQSQREMFITRSARGNSKIINLNLSF